MKHEQTYRRLEQGTAIILLFMFTNGFQALLFGPRPSQGSPGILDEQSSNVIRMAWLPIYAAVLVLAIRRPRRIVGLALSTPWLTLLLLLAPLSVLWSISPVDSLRRGGALLVTAVFGFYLAAAFDHRTLLRLLAWGLGLAMTLSLLTALVWPEIGVMEFTHAGAWRGAFGHKNTLGHMALLEILVLTVLLCAGEHPRKTILLGLLLALTLLLASRSQTALVVGMLVAQTLLLVMILRARNGLFCACGGLFLAVLVVIEAGVLSWFLDDLLAALGRDSTLSGRTLLWSEAWRKISLNVWGGNGYGGAIWQIPSGAVYRVWGTIDEQTYDARSGFVDVWLDLGLAGIAALFMALFVVGVRLAARLREGELTGVYWTAGYLCYLLAISVVESYVSRPNNLLTVLFVTTLAAAGTIRQDTRLCVATRRLASHRVG